VGTYQAAASAADCDACPAGKYSADTGATYDGACADCAAGQYAFAEGASRCAVCPAGKSSAAGSAECTTDPVPSPAPTTQVFVVEVSATASFVGDFSSPQDFTADMKDAYKLALASSLDSVASPDDVNITRVELVAGRRLDLALRRRLLSATLVVYYKLRVLTTSSAPFDVVSALSAELTSAFNSSAFADALAVAGGDLFDGCALDLGATVSVCGASGHLAERERVLHLSISLFSPPPSPPNRCCRSPRYRPTTWAWRSW